MEYNLVLDVTVSYAGTILLSQSIISACDDNYLRTKYYSNSNSNDMTSTVTLEAKGRMSRYH